MYYRCATIQIEKTDRKNGTLEKASHRTRDFKTSERFIILTNVKRQGNNGEIALIHLVRKRALQDTTCDPSHVREIYLSIPP